MVSVHYFAWVAEKIGKSQEMLEVTEGATPGSMIDRLVVSGPNYAEAFANAKRIRCAIDHEFAPLNTPLSDGCELAFFPPVTGG